MTIAKRDGFIHKAIVHRFYSTSKSARNALRFLQGLNLLKPTENGNKWVYTKFETERQKKLEAEIKE